VNRLAELVLESATDYAIITMDLQGLITSWSPGAKSILGWDEFEVLSRQIDLIFTPEDRASNVPAKELGNALAHGRSLDERWHIRKDGTTFWASGEMLPLADGGPPEGFLKILRDRTPQKRAEELQHLLSQELTHRIKNMIAVLQSIVSQSFRGAEDMAAAKAAILRRLAVLNTSQDILVAGATEGTPLKDLLEKALAFAEEPGRSKRIDLGGPHVHLGPGATMSMALIVHELLTNALKYGALSVPDGVVEVKWQLAIMDDQPALRFVWTENGGPAVVPPTRNGFGSRLVRAGISGARSTVDLDFASQGIQCTIMADLAGLQTG
jgi:PAS domain S-box-containing protein